MIFGEGTFAETAFSEEQSEPINLFRKLLDSVDSRRTFLVELVLRQLSG